MKLTIRVEDGPGGRTAEFAGPEVLIGRRPDADLSLSGPLSDAVSGQHARVELLPAGPLLHDTNSRNGVLHNGRRVEGPVTLRVGDRVQLGHTGPTLVVAGWEPPAPPPQPTPPRRPLPEAVEPAAGSPKWLVPVIAATSVGGALLAAAVVFVATRPTPTPAPAEPTQVAVAAVTRPAPATTEAAPATEPRPTAVAPPPAPPAPQSVALGRYVSLPNWPPSVLVSRPGEWAAWTPLRAENAVPAGQLLVSLPGYRSVIDLDSGLRVTLWGELPELSAGSPVLESRAVLNPPQGGAAADVTLDRGRVVIGRVKPGGPSRAALRFGRQTWHVTLTGPQSEAAAELFQVPGQGGGASQPCLALFSRGGVRVETPAAVELPDAARLAAVGDPPRLDGPAQMRAPPAWWTGRPDTKDDAVAEALLALGDWAAKLLPDLEAAKKRSKDAGVDAVDVLSTGVKENTDDPALRRVGVMSFAALDAVGALALHLDRPDAAAREAAAAALRVWLLRDAEHAAELVRVLRLQQYSTDKADLVVRMLTEPARPTMSDQLTHENLIVRGIASARLGELDPKGAAEVKYDPAGEEDARRQAAGRWAKRLAGR